MKAGRSKRPREGRVWLQWREAKKKKRRKTILTCTGHARFFFPSRSPSLISWPHHPCPSSFSTITAGAITAAAWQYTAKAARRHRSIPPPQPAKVAHTCHGKPLPPHLVKKTKSQQTPCVPASLLACRPSLVHARVPATEEEYTIKSGPKQPTKNNCSLMGHEPLQHPSPRAWRLHCGEGGRGPAIAIVTPCSRHTRRPSQHQASRSIDQGGVARLLHLIHSHLKSERTPSGTLLRPQTRRPTPLPGPPSHAPVATGPATGRPIDLSFG